MKQKSAIGNMDYFNAFNGVDGLLNGFSLFGITGINRDIPYDATFINSNYVNGAGVAPQIADLRHDFGQEPRVMIELHANGN
jgi:hypothetical protein